MVILPGSFVIARLVPHLALRQCVDDAGKNIARSIKTRPFLALPLYDPQWTWRSFEDLYILIVSPVKPVGFMSNAYVPIFPHEEGPRRAVRVTPPLPYTKPLYIHTYGGMHLGHSTPVPSVSRDHVSFNIESADIDRIWGYVQSDVSMGHHCRHLEERAKASSGGSDIVQSQWSSWSGRSTSVMAYAFELSELHEVPNEVPAIFKELATIQRVGQDYAWSGVSDTISWVKNLRKAEAILEVGNTEENKEPGSLDSLPNNLQTLALHSMVIPFDGDPIIEAPVSDVPMPNPAARSMTVSDYMRTLEPDEEDEWVFNFEKCPDPLPATKSQDLRVICFDVYGTLVNREQGLLDMVEVVSRGYSECSAEEALQVYLECEATQQMNSSHPTYLSVVQSSLKAFARHLGVSLDNQLGEALAADVQRWQVWPDVHETLVTLQLKGLKVVALVNADSETFAPTRRALETGFVFDDIIESPSSKGLHHSLPSTYSSLVQRYSKALGVRPDQILVVTSGLYRTVEPATTAGLPTAWIRRKNSLEGCNMLSAVAIAKPTHQAVGLKELRQCLGF